MNKKLIAGILFAVVAGASFWACGEGDVSKWNSDDEALGFLVSAEEEAEALKKEGLDSCLKDDYCKSKYAEYFANPNGDTPDDIPSSNDNGNSGTNPGQSSSSIGNHNPFDIVDETSSSSAARIDDNPPIDQSSSSVEVITGLGKCEPVTTPIEKNTGSTKWTFTPNLNAGYTAIDFAKATYAWNFGAGATPATDGTPSTSAAVSYANSGTATASVTVTIGGGSETIQCKPLQVNGDPITGCKCAPVGVTGSVDYTTTPDVAWSVTGCTSASMPLTYNWNGADGAETFTNSFTAATASYAPTLKVGNADNTVIDVPCSAVKVTEGAEYTIKNNTDAGKISLPGEGTYNVVIAFACQNKTFFCNGVGGPVGGSVNDVPMKSDWYTTAALTDADCTGSASVSVTVTGPATCGAQ
ncbi:MAG: hypothetical protein IKM81_02355 [Fibrobacter sp.]|nr:hypothetical protein [Fibrobacter sp.]